METARERERESQNSAGEDSYRKGRTEMESTGESVLRNTNPVNGVKWRSDSLSAARSPID